MEILIAVWLLSGVVAALIWSSRGGNGLEGFLMGLVLGIFGIIMAAAMTPAQVKMKLAATRECPHCRQRIPINASLCSFCQRESPAYEYIDGLWWMTQNGDRLYYNNAQKTWVYDG